MSLFGSSGIRRNADRSLLEITLRTGLALGHLHRRVVIGADTRTSGGALKHALISGLLFSGARCYDAGIVPTPTLAIAASKFDAGVMITASHNPPNYNGLKVFNPDGSSYVSIQQEELERMITSPLQTAPWDSIEADCLTWESAVEDHVQRILTQVKPTKGIKVALDCGCGAASVISPALLRKLNCEVIGLNTNPSGFFPHDIEPIERNLPDLIRICGSLGIIGIAHDGDADRMMAVDEKGRFITGDTMLMLLAQFLGAKDVVTTVDASMVVEETGLNTKRTKVGDTYVSEQLMTWGQFGGEPSGAWVFPANSLCPDGIFGAAILVAMAREENLSAMVDAIPQYCVLRGSVPAARDHEEALQSILKTKPRQVDNTDGTKLIYEDAWALIRASGTEPKLRITVEAKSKARAHEIYDFVVRAVEAARPTGG